MIILNRVASTNNYAMGLIKTHQATHQMAVFAFDQTAGKGRMGKRWNSEPSANIHLSAITQMHWASLHHQFYLSIAAALSVAQLIEDYCGSEVFVKWPNDIIINDRKAAGILIENVIRGQLWQWAVTGIGLNVNQVHFENEQATSLTIETSNTFDVLTLARELKAIFFSYVDAFENQQHAGWLETFNARLYKKNEITKVQAGSRVFETIIAGVTPNGKLITRDVIEQEWNPDSIRILYQSEINR